MKRSALVVIVSAVLVAAPAAAQWTGMPVWNDPKGGTGITISGEYGRPNSAYGKGNAWGGRAALGVGTVTLTAGVATYKPEGSSDATTTVGGQAAFRVIGGSLLPFAVNLQAGAGTSTKITSSNYPKRTSVTGAVGMSVLLPTPGVSIEPYFSPGIRYIKTEDAITGVAASQTKFGYALGANLTFGMLGVHLAYDYQKLDVGRDRKSTRLNSSHLVISYAVFCLKKKSQARLLLTPPPRASVAAMLLPILRAA